MIETQLLLDVSNEPLWKVEAICLMKELSLSIEGNKAYIELMSIKQSKREYFGIDWIR